MGVGCFPVVRFHRRGPILQEGACRNLKALHNYVPRVPLFPSFSNGAILRPFFSIHECTRILSFVLGKCLLRLLHVARPSIARHLAAVY